MSDFVRPKRSRRLSLLLFALLGLGLVVSAGCDTGAPDDEFINGISLREIEESRLPTYAELATAFDVVVARDASVLDSDSLLARAVFDEWNRDEAQARTAKRTAGVADISQLNREERIVVLLYPGPAYLARNVPALTKRVTEAAYPCDNQSTQFEEGTIGPFNADKADAVRHAYWNALSAKRVADSPLYSAGLGLVFMEALGEAHESQSRGTALNESLRVMDLSNNAAGRRVFDENRNATDDELLNLIIALPLAFAEEGDAITEDDSRLIYFVRRADFDVTMTGSFTNPDSGGPWDATLTVNQCGETIRGGLDITRDGGRQQRSITGVLSGSTLNLIISNPIGSGGNPCRAMKAELSGDADALSGPWTSSNCSQGGQISVSRTAS